MKSQFFIREMLAKPPFLCLSYIIYKSYNVTIISMFTARTAPDFPQLVNYYGL